MLIWLYPLILTLVPLALAAAWFRSKQPGRAVYVPATHFFPPSRGLRMSWSVVALVIGSVLAVMAAAAPALVLPTLMPTRAVLMVVLDNSASMAEVDVPSLENQLLKRWDVATNELMNVLQDRANGTEWTVGLVLCAGHAELVCPPVQGLASLEPFIRGAGPQQQSGLSGTDLSSGLVVALEAAMASDAPARAVLLISDGENNATPPESGKTMQQLGQLAKALNVPCHSLEVAGASNSNQKTSVARRNLKELGEITGGIALQANTTMQTKEELDKVMKAVDKVRQQIGEYKRWPLNAVVAISAALFLTMYQFLNRNGY